MLTKNTILEIFISQLLLSGMCRTKLIENESFHPNSRFLKIFNDEDDPNKVSTHIPSTKTIELISEKNIKSPETSVKVNQKVNSETLVMFNGLGNNSSDKTKVQLTNQRKNLNKKIERKIDMIGGSNIDGTNLHQNILPQFFYAKPQNQSNFYLNRTSKYYINYRQAYGIRYNPNKIRRSFNFESGNEENHYNEENDEDEQANLIDTETTLPEIINATASADETSTIQSATNYFIDYMDTSSFPNANTEKIPFTISEDIQTLDDDNYTLIPQYKPIDSFLNDDDTTETTTTFFNDFTSGSVKITNSSDGSHSTNIMKPSRVQAALQFLNSRVKNLFTYGLPPATAVAKSPPLKVAGNGQRFLNLFNVIKFQNIPCASQKAPLTQMNGTCYHKFECDQLGGIAVDECAGGFGVCCIC